MRARAANERSGLERLLAPLEPVRMVDSSGPRSEPEGEAITCRVGDGDPVWLEAGDWRVYARPSADDGVMSGSDHSDFTLANGTAVRAQLDHDRNSVSVPFSLAEAYENYVSEAWRSSVQIKELQPWLLDAFYRVKRFVPRSLQLEARRALVRRQRAPEFPSWPWDDSVIRLLKFYAHSALVVSGRDELSFRWFWPYGRTGALALGHDVESREGLRLAVELADVEEELGFRSVFNLGMWYAIDDGIVRELTERGFEIGLHGIHHDRRLFGSRSEFERQLPLLGRAAAELHAEGFRSPSTYRVFDWLGELPVSYDASISHSDPFEAQPGGCCSVWPFFIGQVVELPYTLPQDHTLLTLLKARSVDLWIEQAERIERHHGLIHCVSHPDRGYLGDREKRVLYAEFLRAMADRAGLWHALPRDVARWWRLRDRASDAEAPIVRGVARRGEHHTDAVFESAPLVTRAELTPDLDVRLAEVLVTSNTEQEADIAVSGD